jgi:biopolymer transport protein ExbD
LAPSRRRRALSLTSLIDVIFLLLLFFMLASTFARPGDLPFLAAGAGAAAAPGDTPPAFLRVLPDRIVLNTAEIAPEGLAAALAALPGTTVLVAPGAGVTAQRLVDVLALAQGVAGVNLRLIGG